MIKPVEMTQTQRTETTIPGWQARFLFAEKGRLVLSSVFLFLACIPLLRMWNIVDSVGANNLSNDYIYMVPIIGEILDGTYKWENFLGNTLHMGHLSIFPVLTHLTSALVSNWDARFDLRVGILFAFIRFLLLFSLLSTGLSRTLKRLLCGAMIALIFSASQASNFLYGQNSIEHNLSLLGFTLGLWGIVQCNQKWCGITLMLLGGLISSLSNGNFIPCWLSFLFALMAFHYTRRSYYWAWFLGFATIACIYSYFLFFSARSPYTTASSTLEQKVSFVVNALGRPFCNGIGANCDNMVVSAVVGSVGLILAGGLSLWALRQHFDLIKREKVAVILTTYGLLSILIIGMVRVLVVPWYSLFAISFWIGVVSLSISLIARSGEQVQSTNAKMAGAMGITSLLFIGFFYVSTNRTYEDKTMLLYSRSPASESVLRNFDTAPTYSQVCLFQNGDDQRALKILGEPLRRHGLSAFAPKQEWTLQGDFPLHNFSSRENNSKNTICWLEGTDLKSKASWRSYKHLNIYIPSNCEVQWDLDLPFDLRSASLTTAYIAEGPTNGEPAAASPAVEISSAGLAVDVGKRPFQSLSDLLKHSVYGGDVGCWTSAVADLSQLRGKHVSIKFRCVGSASSNQGCVFEYPRLDIERPRNYQRSYKEAERQVQSRPSNTDLSTYFPESTVNDYVFPDLSSDQWSPGLSTISPSRQNNPYQTISPTLSYSFQKPVDLAKYAYLHMEMSMPLDPESRRLAGLLNLNNGEVKYVSVPLLWDSGLHKYCFDLRLLEIEGNPRIEKITIMPVAKNCRDTNKMINLTSLRLIAKRCRSGSADH